MRLGVSFPVGHTPLHCCSPASTKQWHLAPSLRTRTKLALAALPVLLVSLVGVLHADFRARDPGVRGGSPGAGDPLPGLADSQLAMFEAGKEDFEEVEGVGDGLGPRFHQYAQQRYQELTGRVCPAQGGPTWKQLSREQRQIDREARLTISAELGHSRIEIVAVYCGR